MREKLWPRPTDCDASKPDPSDCPYCAMTPNFNLDEIILNRRRRGHRLFDLNYDASGICRAIRARKISINIRKSLATPNFHLRTT